MKIDIKIERDGYILGYMKSPFVDTQCDICKLWIPKTFPYYYITTLEYDRTANRLGKRICSTCSNDDEEKAFEIGHTMMTLEIL